jgi:hypothetical protein
MMAVAACALAIGNAQAQIGSSTAKDFELIYGQPVVADNSQVDFRVYLSGDKIVAAVYDEKTVCQGVCFYRLGNENFTE